MTVKLTFWIYLLTTIALPCYSQDFITIWKTDNPGVSASNQITIPTVGSGYAYSIYWEEVGNNAVNGAIAGPIEGDYTVTFPSAGTYRIKISGSFPQIFFFESDIGNTKDNKKILNIEHWGLNIWANMEAAFYECSNLTITATDAPNLTQVTNMSWMFFGTEKFNNSINHWDVSHVVNMSNLFRGSAYNQPLEAWDVSNVEYMDGMFYASPFNQPLNSWNVSKVTTMESMFQSALNFNQMLDLWNVNKVTNMKNMFSYTTFNQPINKWNVGQVKNMDYMFLSAQNFNQPLNAWNTSGLTSAEGMFLGASDFNQPLENWVVSDKKNMALMFRNAPNFNQPLDNWKVSNVESMDGMLDNTALSVSSYDETLISWSAQDVRRSLTLGAQGLKYCLGAVARAQLIAKGWVITGDMSLIPTKPVLSLQQPVCSGETGTITITIQNPTDTYSFDGGATFQASHVKPGLGSGQYSIIIKNALGCSSFPEQVVINNPFQKSPTPVLTGSPIVCPNVQTVGYTANNTDYAYQWFIKGGTLAQQQNNGAKVNWGSSNFNAAVKAVGIDNNNCPTDTAIFPVKIQIQLKPDLPVGFDSVCFNFRFGVPYQTSYTNGSAYTWLTNGGTLAEGQGTSTAKINWANEGIHKLWVFEENTTSTDYCSGTSDTLRVTVFQDLAAITMNFVSVDYVSDKHVQLQWDVSLLERVSDLIIVSRRIVGSTGSWETVATLDKNVQSFLDENLATSANIYEYRVEGFNKCDEGLQTVIHNTIKLAGDKVEEEELINLDWNDYNGWNEVEHYEVWRKLDAETDYKLIDITPGDLTLYSGKHGADGFVHHLRVKAKKKDANTISWSNEIELNFENPIDFIPNVITPNGDLKNDFFIVPKLHLYPDNALTIYDRWGKTVFTKNNYDNSWGGVGLPEGIYFYALYIKSLGKNLTGWVQLVR